MTTIDLEDAPWIVLADSPIDIDFKSVEYLWRQDANHAITSNKYGNGISWSDGSGSWYPFAYRNDPKWIKMKELVDGLEKT